MLEIVHSVPWHMRFNGTGNILICLSRFPSSLYSFVSHRNPAEIHLGSHPDSSRPEAFVAVTAARMDDGQLHGETILEVITFHWQVNDKYGQSFLQQTL
jgi:hypothetical protein